MFCRLIFDRSCVHGLGQASIHDLTYRPSRDADVYNRARGASLLCLVYLYSLPLSGRAGSLAIHSVLGLGTGSSQERITIMDEEVNDMHLPQAPIVVEETETEDFEHKVEPSAKPESGEEEAEGTPAVEEGRFCSSLDEQTTI